MQRIKAVLFVRASALLHVKSKRKPKNSGCPDEIIIWRSSLPFPKGRTSRKERCLMGFFDLLNDWILSLPTGIIYLVVLMGDVYKRQVCGQLL